MKHVFYAAAFFILCIACYPKPESPADWIGEIRDSFAKSADSFNAKTIRWQNLIDSVYAISDTSDSKAISAIQTLLDHDESFDWHQIDELHYLKGRIYCKMDSLRQSVYELSLSRVSTPRDLTARAETFIKLKQFDSALSDLRCAARINYDVDWNIGNYYEIIKQKDSAQYYYGYLYLKDSAIYQKCKDRIKELNRPDPHWLNELILNDRKMAMVLLHPAK